MIKGIWVGPGTLRRNGEVFVEGDEVELPLDVVRSIGDSFAPSVEKEKPKKAPKKATKKPAKK